MAEPGYSGVKKPEFDQLVDKHALAARQLTDLGEKLHAELARAGLDTAPAQRARALAARADKQAKDLRRRQQIVRDMERQKIDLGMPMAGSSFIRVPDSLEAARGQLAGNAAAAAVRGDPRKALAELEKFAGKNPSPEFIKGFLSKIDPRIATELPAVLAKRLRDAADRGEDTTALARQSTLALKTLSAALAKGTDPADPAYLGDKFLNGLVVEGRKEHKIDDMTYLGYQAQALVWRASDGRPPFSAKFMETVGADAVAQEKRAYESRWKQSEALHGRVSGTLMDLAALLKTRNLYGPAITDPGKPPTGSSVIDDLVHAAGFSAPAAQALLSYRLDGGKRTILSYFMTQRWAVFKHTRSQEPLGRMLRTALTDKSSAGARLTEELLGLTRKRLEGAYVSGEDLKIKDPGKLEEMAFLRRPLGAAMVAQFDAISSAYTDDPRFKGLQPADMTWLFLFVGRDEQAFKDLLTAQYNRLSDRIEESYRKSGGEYLKSMFRHEGKMLGYILETRRLALMAESKTREEAQADVKAKIDEVMGLLVSPAGKFGTQVAGEIGAWLAGKAANVPAGALSAWIAGQLIKTELTTPGALHQAGTERQSAVKVIEKLLLAASISHEDYEKEGLNHIAGQSFATTHPPIRLRPIPEILASPKMLADFIKWSEDWSDMQDNAAALESSLNTSADVESHDHLKIPRK
ncbi:hypothetical protein HII36_26965 [Nonomuraea sp. NN258]|uniref:hypothetical protein n=1 Tax=Nonomuraea antri TaxID=2730852 RepID=UPI0015693560|nr:hypothetical protein [Nonomuraea antri]NRQ35443.1 hypothetical protein [Nonomuraea antri]